MGIEPGLSDGLRDLMPDQTIIQTAFHCSMIGHEGLLAQALAGHTKMGIMSGYFQRLRKKLNPFHMLLAFYILIAVAGIIYRVLS